MANRDVSKPGVTLLEKPFSRMSAQYDSLEVRVARTPSSSRAYSHKFRVVQPGYW